MCTAITYQTKDHYFGRNLDLEYGYHETVTVTPRNYPFRFRKVPDLTHHYAMIGMATVIDAYPLYYEATNEKGLSMAGLNFPRNAQYLPAGSDADEVAPFEFIPWILGQCATVPEARRKLETLRLVDIPFNEQLPLSPLHWIISDRDRSIVAEPMADGLKVYDDPIGILTNEPPFDFHLYHLSNFMNVSTDQAIDRFSKGFSMRPYSNGMGGIGLPGDFSSASRFVRAAFVKLNAVSAGSEEESVSQFFHILGSVAMPRGCVRMGPDSYEITRYSCCCNTDRGIYYYTTYENSQITGIDMHREDLDSTTPIAFPLVTRPQFRMQNQV
ncbi:MAG: choloylglycine hydrolase [Oscillospiraceae bacterium]|nr:choloylglycine hydrolase [Oscillospiraceae bacterium]